ncbi:hypothetical protein [Caenispirillum salinarum]|uniref:hypothetical protein n=1 Tax=Caenispirillum salinarum TaxID=859058 RepID=UPI00384A9A23
MAAYLPSHLTAQQMRDPRQQLAQALVSRGTSTEPVQHWLQGAARMANTWVGNRKMDRLDKEYADKGTAYRTSLAEALKSKDPLGSLSQSNDPRLLGLALQGKLQQANREPTPTFETVNNPFGRGGVGQRNTLTGKIEGFQGPPTPRAPEPLEKVLGEDGRPMLVPRSRAAGMTPYSDAGGASAREERISRIEEAYGVPRQTAVGIADGVLKLQTDPVNGGAFLVNMATGEKSQLRDAPQQTAQGGMPKTDTVATTNPNTETLPGGDMPYAGNGADPSLWDMADEVTGMFPAIQENLQGVTGQVGIDVAPDGLIENRQTFRTAKNDLVRALSINPRFPVGEIERISREVNIEPGIFTDPRSLRGRMTAVGDYLGRRLANEEAAARDQSLPVETRQNAATAAKDIRNFLDILGAPADGERGDPARGDISAMSLEQLQGLDPSQMSDEDLAAAAERFRQLEGR